MTPVLSVQSLCFSYGTAEVLCGVTFAVDSGDYLAIAGPNGAGKTTLVRTVLGLATPRQGEVALFGQPINRFTEWQRIGYLPQRVTAFNPLFPATVEEVVGLGLLCRKKFPRRFDRADRTSIRHALDLLAIGNLSRKLVGELSGGQQQRVFLARALVTQPELLILDEPSTALDPDSREGFLELLKRLNREQRVTIVLISHDTTTVSRYAEKLLYLDKTVVFHGVFRDFAEFTIAQHHSGICPAPAAGHAGR